MVSVHIADPSLNAWMHDGECRGMDPEGLFFPVEGQPFDPKPAKRICNGHPDDGTIPCPVKDVCLERALLKRDTYVVRGGMTEDERRAEIRRRQRAPRKPDEPKTETEADTGGNGSTLPQPPSPPTLTNLTVSSRLENPQGPRLARLIAHLATELIADHGSIVVAGDPFLQGLAEAMGHSDWEKTLATFRDLSDQTERYQLLFEKLLFQLTRRKCTVTVTSDTALERLAQAIGFATWSKARFSHIDSWAKAGIVAYLPFNSQLIVHCHLAQARLDREERDSRMPGDIWSAQTLTALKPAMVPPEYRHLVHEDSAYTRSLPYKKGMVEANIIWEILRRIVLAGGVLRDVVAADLAQELAISPITMGRALQNLDSGGLIQRDRSKDRGRTHSDLRLTGHGVEWLLTNRAGFIKRFARQSA